MIVFPFLKWMNYEGSQSQGLRGTAGRVWFILGGKFGPRDLDETR